MEVQAGKALGRLDVLKRYLGINLSASVVAERGVAGWAFRILLFMRIYTCPCGREPGGYFESREHRKSFPPSRYGRGEAEPSVTMEVPHASPLSGSERLENYTSSSYYFSVLRVTCINTTKSIDAEREGAYAWCAR